MKPRIAIPQPSSDPAYVAKVMPQYRRAVEMAGGQAVEILLAWDNQQIARAAAGCDAILLPGCRADVNPEKYGAAPDPRTAPDDPRRDNADELLLQDAYNLRKPVLGICFGLQSLNVWRTGTLRQHLETGVQHSGNTHQPAPPHPAVIDPASRLARIIETVILSDPERSEGESRAPYSLPLCHPERARAQRTEGPCASERPTGNGGRKTGNVILVNSSHHQAADIVGDGLRAVAWCPKDNVIEALEGTAPDHFVLAVQWHPERMVDEDAAARAIFRALADAASLRHERLRAGARDFESAR